MIESLINTLLQGVLNLVSFLINILLTPIDNFISTNLPTISGALSSVDYLINECIKYIGLVISYSGITSSTINIIIPLIVFLYTVPLLVHGIKLSIKWFKTLRG